MPDFSHVIPESHQNVSSRILETLIQTQREASFTGLMRLNHFPDENLIFSFLGGKQEKLYRCRDGAVEILPRQDWQDVLDRASDFVGFLHLPIEAMRFARVTHEAPVHQVDRATLSTEQLTTVIEKWAAEHEPGIVHLRGDSVNRYYLIAGASTPAIEELSVLDGEAHFSLNNVAFPTALPRLEYQVIRYASVHDHDVWREYELRLAFHPFMYMLVNRFSELAGRALTERLCEQVSGWAREAGWKVSLNSNGIVNREYFHTLEKAVAFYVDFIRRFQAEASPALGPRMIEGVIQEILIKIDPYRRGLLTKSVFSWFGVGSGTGGDWR